MTMQNRALWRKAIQRHYTPESLIAAAKSGDFSKLETKPEKKSLLDSIGDLEGHDNASRYDLYLQLKAKIPNASSGTLRKLRRRLGIA